MNVCFPLGIQGFIYNNDNKNKLKTLGKIICSYSTKVIYILIKHKPIWRLSFIYFQYDFIPYSHIVWLFTSLQERLQEVLQAIGEAAHHIAGVAVLRKEKGQLEVWILLELNLSAVTPRQLICCVFRHCHHVVYQLLNTQKPAEVSKNQFDLNNSSFI